MQYTTKSPRLQAEQASRADPGTSEQRWNAVRACIAKAEKAASKARDWQITAGEHLKVLKAEHDAGGGTWPEWEQLVKEKAGIGKSRASELMAIADGRKTNDEVRADTSHRQQEYRNRLRYNGENADEPKARSATPLPAISTGADTKGREQPATRKPSKKAKAKARRQEAKRKASERMREAFMAEQLAKEAEVKQLATKMIALDRDFAHQLHAHLIDGWLKEALRRGLGLESEEDMAKQLATKAIALDRNVAHQLHAYLPNDAWLKDALRWGLGLEGEDMAPWTTPPPAQGNDADARASATMAPAADDAAKPVDAGNDTDPEQAAEQRKLEFAELENDARDASDPGDISACLRTSP